MPRWIWFAPLSLLVLVLGLWAFRLGWIAATITETDVIETYTSRYLEAGGPLARPTDCSAQPGAQAAIWILVSCVNAAGVRVDFPVDRLGRLLDVAPHRAVLGAPQT
ncbi:MAG: hypothetical protein AAGI36_12125 [Pseudomonadota bacterium]